MNAPAVALLLSLTAAASPQAPAGPRFDVISVKQTPPDRQNRLRRNFCGPGGNFLVAGTPVMWIVTYAFRLKELQIVGAPDWLNRFESGYDIEAKPASAVTEAQCRLMLQSLLADRFKLKTHRESRDAPVYLLTVAK